MFSKVALVTVSLAIFATATTIPQGGNNQCSTGSVQCCNTVESADSAQAAKAIAGLGSLITGPITGQVGLACNPISVIGGGFNSCKAQTACCTDNNYNGVVVVGCSPISAL
ncbi:fruiting body protein SC1 [Crucibulum laeve]|uniref:Hydrophobin n=1 Tax=Crucibulum laeve TaxID=68775 RepID=A0A5C3M891_9AGAR|nr:fruiting body protein SC1 [Crucibulum laeve]